MNKASLLASAAVAALLAGSAAMPVFAQGTGGPFADVPVDHWAYKAVDTLQKDGVVIGYPDGTYGGKRAMTRYEFAVAIARLLDKLPKPDMSMYVTHDELNTALTPYAKLSDLAGLAKQSDLDALKKLVDEFQTELTTLGVDLDATKRRLDALEGRVAAIEKEIKRVQISGDTNIMGRANNRFNQTQIIDQDGAQVTGTGRGSLLSDARVFHDVDIEVKAHLNDTTTADTILNYGNYLPFIGSIGSYNFQDSLGAVGRSNVNGSTVVNQSEQFSVYRAVIETPVHIKGIGGAQVAVGRLPIQFTPYTLKLIDTDAYFYNSKTDLGDIPVDGAKLRLNLGPVTATGFAAKIDPIQFLSSENTNFNGDLTGYGLYAGAGYGGYTGFLGQNGFGAAGGVRQVSNYGTTTYNVTRPFGASVNPAVNGAMSIEQMAGVHANFGTGRFGTIGGTYLYAAGSASPFAVSTAAVQAGAQTTGGYNATNFNRVIVYGADINTNIAGFGVVGSYTKSDTAGPHLNTNGDGSLTIDTGTHSDITNKNSAWEASATYGKGAFTINGGYRNVDPYFAAPGSWDKVGSYTNPTDIKGAFVSGTYNFTNLFALTVGGKFYQGTGEAQNDGGLTSGDKINNFKAGLRYGLTSASGIDAGIERTEYKIGDDSNGFGGDKPIEYFYNIGYGYSFTPAASFKILYQIIDFRDKNATNFDPVSSKGGVAATQFSVKF